MTQPADRQLVYQDPSRPVEERVQDLLERMTIEEKIAQLGSAWVYQILERNSFSEAKARELMAHGIGQITRMGGASNLRPLESARLANTIQDWLIANTRLGIPAMIHEECCSGYMALSATCFPQAIGVAASWNPDLVEEMSAVIKTQMRSVGAHQALAPVLDVTRDPRWGRVEETFGEDPYLIAEMGSAFVRGLQGKDWSEGVLATGKHFVGYGMGEGGMNWAPAHIGPRELYEVYIFPFEAAIKTADMASIMNGYHELDGVPCGANRELLIGFLREKLGFAGLIVSDYFAVDQLATYHNIARDKKEAAKIGLESGIDIELPSTDCYSEPLRQALESNELSMERFNEAVALMLRTKFELGLFENPHVVPDSAPSVFDTPEQRALARQIARESIVLLKNEGDLLPLDKATRSIAVIGPNADSTRNLVGDYAYPAHIETLLETQDENLLGGQQTRPDTIIMVEDFVEIISVLDGIRAKLGPDTEIRYAPGVQTVLDKSTEGFAEAVEIARQSDVAIVVVGEKSGLTASCTCGEARDRAELGLPGVQQQLVEAIHATGTPVVVVLVSGRPQAVPWIAEHIPAILHAWLPGEEGANAIADVLFGDYNPGGKLPISVPVGVGQVPVFYGHKLSGGRSHWKVDYVEMSTKPLYEFGFGLSYTRFEYANLSLSTGQAAAGDQVEIRLDVTNTGARAGDEIVQLYCRTPDASITRPVKELKGFTRVSLEPGETRTVVFTLAVNQLAFLDQNMQFGIEPGTIEVMIGSSSNDIRLNGSFEITGPKTDVSDSKVYFSTVRVE
ncbi:MAG: beta-glucosidase [Chloroflexi bacterium]|nr:beta-glucosidase [Chloroflexota bacterium]